MYNFIAITLATAYTGKKWLDTELKKQGYSSYDNILLATITNGNLSVFEKDYQKQIEVLE